jgi:hypothetical protein
MDAMFAGGGKFNVENPGPVLGGLVRSKCLYGDNGFPRQMEQVYICIVCRFMVAKVFIYNRCLNLEQRASKSEQSYENSYKDLKTKKLFENSSRRLHSVFMVGWVWTFRFDLGDFKQRLTLLAWLARNSLNLCLCTDKQGDMIIYQER